MRDLARQPLYLAWLHKVNGRDAVFGQQENAATGTAMAGSSPRYQGPQGLAIARAADYDFQHP
jgi:hypothetical protein